MQKRNFICTTKVPASVFSAWEKRKSRGDVANLIAETGFSKPTIIQALKHGKASQELILDISKYFSEKETNFLEIEKQALAILKSYFYNFLLIDDLM